MSELFATAERLRVVKDACVDFLILWAVDAMMTETFSGERLWGDVQGSAASADNFEVRSKFGRSMDD